ncbi:hypothetical protein ATI61_11298 [Archangium gephyra]|uniref:Lipoprotein n=1 Tax=Archangium gephyra TaxID=48 RepID=A0ABX9JS59_9BACT|nr:hypothetical protein [Archangium gephyra]REG26003.1 hypothetical protein ATI61_11298 [Archangium gephyra]
MLLRSLLALALLCLTGCPASPIPEEPLPANPLPANNPDLPSFAELPSSLRDEPFIPMHGGLPLSFDEALADGITAAADCAALVTSCLERTNGDFDTCVAGTPTCATEQPWTEEACCPKRCKTDFNSRRAAGRGGFDTYIDVFVKEMTCFPSVEAP